MFKCAVESCENKMKGEKMLTKQNICKHMKEKNVNPELLNYKKFCEEFKEKVVENPSFGIAPEDYKFYPDGYSGDDEHEREFVKSTNVKYHSMESEILKGDYVVLMLDTAGESKCMCRFSMEYLFEEYEAGGWERIEYILTENISLAVGSDVDHVFECLTEYEELKELLIIRPINYENNKYELKNCVYKLYGDVALVLYAVLYNDERGFGSVKIPKEVVEVWGKDTEEVWEIALINTYIDAQPRLYANPLEVINSSFEKGAFMAWNSDINHLDKFQIPLVTTTRRMNGAIAMFYPGVKEKIAKMFGSDFYLTFTSIHEARVHHCQTLSPQMIQESLNQVNSFSEEPEILSQMVFYYDSEKNTLEPLSFFNS